jgi:hypothetical protein
VPYDPDTGEWTGEGPDPGIATTDPSARDRADARRSSWVKWIAGVVIILIAVGLAAGLALSGSSPKPKSKPSKAVVGSADWIEGFLVGHSTVHSLGSNPTPRDLVVVSGICTSSAGSGG